MFQSIGNHAQRQGLDVEKGFTKIIPNLMGF